MQSKGLREELAGVVSEIHARGWSSGTGGNFSVRISTSPPRLLMTPSGIDKGEVKPEDLIEVDERGVPVSGGRPSAEMPIHIAIMLATDAGAVLHTHSVWNTLLSLEGNGITISGYEMLKALHGVSTHEHEELVPILANSQDMPRFAEEVRALLAEKPHIHAFLMRGHGLYTWGRSLFDAKRHVEALEFLFEVEGRQLQAGGRFS